MDMMVLILMMKHHEAQWGQESGSVTKLVNDAQGIQAQVGLMCTFQLYVSLDAALKIRTLLLEINSLPWKPTFLPLKKTGIQAQVGLMFKLAWES